MSEVSRSTGGPQDSTSKHLISYEVLSHSISQRESTWCRNEAAYARLAGVAPIPANSGQTQDRHRLNRGGDRQLNTALHTVAVTRIRAHPPTQDYKQRRLAEGKTDREIRRCIKRYIARRVYRLLQNPPLEEAA